MAEQKEPINSTQSADDVAVRYDMHPQQGGFHETLKRIFGGDRVLWIIIIALIVLCCCCN